MNVSEVYKNLYYYTTEEGLYGILKSQSLWATDYRDLNDEKEIVYFYEHKFLDFMAPAVEQIYSQILYNNETARNNFFQAGETLQETVKKDVVALVNALMAGIKDNLFIASFAGESDNENIKSHGLLSQWRAYGVGGGFCLIFDTKKLELLLAEEFKQNAHMSLGLYEIIYSDEQEKYISELEPSMEKLAVSCRGLMQAVAVSDSVQPPTIAYQDLIKCISSYKHFGFKEEREIRLVSHLVPKEFKFTDTRQVNKIENSKSSKKYIELFFGSDFILPIKKIIVGPHVDKKKRATELRTFLKNNNMEDIEVAVSDIPYVTR